MLKTKRIIALLLSAALLTACGDNNDIEEDLGNDYIFDSDSQTMFQGSGNQQQIVMSDTGYYFQIGQFLYYSDFDNIDPIPLCSNVNCSHATNTCDAYIENTSSYYGSIQYYDGYIYTITTLGLGIEDINSEKYNIWRISIDGTEKKLIKCVPSIAGIVVHRGYIYYIEPIFDAVEDGTSEGSGTYNVHKMTVTGEDDKIIYTQVDNQITGIAAAGNYLYISSTCGFGSVDYIYNILEDSIKKFEQMKILI